MGEYLFFDGQRKGTKRKATRMLALRVPCDAQLSRRDVKLAIAQTVHPETPGSISASRQA